MDTPYRSPQRNSPRQDLQARAQQAAEQEEQGPGNAENGGDGGRTSGQTLKILYLSAQSIVGKIDELAITAGEKDPALILVTESWCNDDIPDAFLTLQGYSLHMRSDRLDTAAGRGGGLLVFVKEGISILSVDKLVDMHQ